MTRESIVRKLGFKKTSKNPLLKEHVNQIVQYFLQRNTVQDHPNVFGVVLAYETTLRWDDYANTILGDFIVTHDFVRVFLVDTKTDNYKSGQWVTFSVSPAETSEYTLFQNLVKNIVVNVCEQSRHNLANFPIMFKSLHGSGNDHEIPKITYNDFLKELKTACAEIGLNPALFGDQMLLRHILIIPFSLNFNFKLWIHQNNKNGYCQVDVNHHTTTPQYSNQRQSSTKNSSIDSIVQLEYFEIILGKVLFNTVTNRIEKMNLFWKNKFCFLLGLVTKTNPRHERG